MFEINTKNPFVGFEIQDFPHICKKSGKFKVIQSEFCYYVFVDNVCMQSSKMYLETGEKQKVAPDIFQSGPEFS